MFERQDSKKNFSASGPRKLVVVDISARTMSGKPVSSEND